MSSGHVQYIGGGGEEEPVGHESYASLDCDPPAASPDIVVAADEDLGDYTELREVSGVHNGRVGTVVHTRRRGIQHKVEYEQSEYHVPVLTPGRAAFQRPLREPESDGRTELHGWCATSSSTRGGLRWTPLGAVRPAHLRGVVGIEVPTGCCWGITHGSLSSRGTL